MGDATRSALRRLGELLALTAFAIAQPLLDVTGRSPDFFLYRRASGTSLVLLLLLVVLGPPLALWQLELGCRLFGELAARRAHALFVAGLFSTILVEVGKHFHVLSGLLLALAAVVVGVGLTVLVTGGTALRTGLMYATPAPLVFGLLFVLTTPAGALVRGGGGSSAARATAAHRPPIVFLFLDEFPLRALLDAQGRIDARLYPNFARLAATTTWYPNATGVSGWTPFAAPALLSGRYPVHAVAPSYVEYPQTLFTMLGGTYRIRAFESIAQLCPPRLCKDVPAGRATGLPPVLHDTLKVARQIVSPYQHASDPTVQFIEESVDQARVDASTGAKPRGVMYRFGELGRNQPARFTTFLDGLVPSDRPTLHFLHLLLPHQPWRFLPSGNVYPTPPIGFVPAPAGSHDGAYGDSAALSVIAQERLLLQLRYTDGLIGQLLDKLKSSGLFDRSLLVVTADHGTGITPGARARQADATNVPDLAWVPMFVKTPGQRAGKVDRRNEEAVDIVPTVADVLHVRVPWHVDGESMLGPPRTTGVKAWFNTPGRLKEIDPKDWGRTWRTGIGPAVVRPDKGVAGLFAAGPHGDLVGRQVADLDIGRRAAPIAALADRRLDFAHVNLVSGSVPAMVWGTFDQPVADDEEWLVVAVNGTVAGTVAALPGPRGAPRFVGLLDDSYLHDGDNAVRMYVVDGGGTLHAIRWKD